MYVLQAMFTWIYSVMNIPFTIGSFTFTLWNVFVFTIISSIIGWALGRLININASE